VEVGYWRAQGFHEVLIFARSVTATAFLADGDVLLQGAEDDGGGVALLQGQRSA
jgi:hypothetical protein